MWGPGFASAGWLPELLADEKQEGTGSANSF